jgi:prepilin-type N-terminal cleavage/methylation domain-containing protein
MKAPSGRSRKGFTVIEVLVAAALLGLMAVAMGLSLSRGTRFTTSSRHHVVAQAIARNQVEHLRSLGPMVLDPVHDVPINETGELDPQGRYGLSMHSSVECQGGPLLPYSAGPATPGCSGTRPTTVYTVEVSYPAREGGNLDRKSVTYSLTLAPTAFFAP